MMFGLFIVFKYPPINCHSALIWQSLSRAVSPWGRRTNFFWHPVLPHKCGVPPDYGTPHLCGSEEFCRAPYVWAGPIQESVAADVKRLIAISEFGIRNSDFERSLLTSAATIPLFLESSLAPRGRGTKHFVGSGRQFT